LPMDMRHMCEEIARERDITLGQFIRGLVSAEISRRKNARPPNRADEQLIAPLRARLATPLATSTNWPDLQDKLAHHDVILREAGGGLAVHRLSTGERLCKASELGFSYSKLMRRFDAPFPGHAHSWLAARMLDQEEDDDIQLVENWPS